MAADETRSLPDGSSPLPDALQDHEKDIIEAALARSKGKGTHTETCRPLFNSQSIDSSRGQFGLFERFAGLSIRSATCRDKKGVRPCVPNARIPPRSRDQGGTVVRP